MPESMPGDRPEPQRWRHGLVVGKFYPLHLGHSHLINVALDRCDAVTVELLASRVESISLETRRSWLREEHPRADVVAAYDEAPVDFESAAAWDEHMVVIEGLLSNPVDAVFTSDAYGAELARRLGAVWVQVDPERRLHPVSGRAVRADVLGNWGFLPNSVRRDLALRPDWSFAPPLELRGRELL